MTRIYALLLSTLLLSTAELAASVGQVNDIRIQGNQRIEQETILSYIQIKKGLPASDEELNHALKELYATGYFTDVKVHAEGNTVVIEVEENPIINRIAYEGNKKLRDDQIKEEIQLRPREVLSRTKIQAAQQRILEMYKAMGRLAATVEPKIIKLEENRADVVFEINEGDTTYIQKINFLGNRHFSKSKLEDALLSKKYRWFRFFANDDTFDPQRFQADQQNLRKFYFDHGYADYQQKSAVSEISPNYSGYHLTFSFDEGKLYKFGKVDIESKIPSVNAEEFRPLILYNATEDYSAKLVERTTEKITDALGAKGYAFTEIDIVTEKHPETQIIDVKLVIKEGPKVYIERIDVIGNDRTRDHVIRRELAIHEGDAYNMHRIKKSERNLKDLGYFKNVEVVAEQGDSPDKAVLLVKVEEQSTGELSFSAGFATVDGPLGQIRFIERNFMGKGQILHASTSIAKRSQEIDLGFVEPYLFGRQLEGSADIFAARSTRFSSYTQITKGTTLGLGYRLSEHFFQSLNYTLKQDRVSHVNARASNYIKQQAGSYITSEVGQTLYYDRRDSRIDTTSGYILSLSNSYAGLGGKVKYLKHVIGGTVYASPIEDVVIALKGSYGVMDKAGKKIRIVDSFFLGADSFRGFQFGGLGPHDNKTGDPLGGTRFWSGTLESLFPIGLPNEFGIKGAIFTDVGSLWKSTETGPGVRDNKFVRQSVGAGLAWNSPFGPIRIDYAVPIKKDKFDDTQRFLLSFKTKL